MTKEKIMADQNEIMETTVQTAAVAEGNTQLETPVTETLVPTITPLENEEVKAPETPEVKAPEGETKVVKVRAKAVDVVEGMGRLVKETFKVGSHIFVVVDNIKQFKIDAVEQLTVRQNKRRTAENRLHWLIHNFVRQTMDMSKKRMTVHLLAATDKEGQFRNEKGFFVNRVTIDNIEKDPTAVPMI
jgi:hypothetical protein